MFFFFLTYIFPLSLNCSYVTISGFFDDCSPDLEKGMTSSLKNRYQPIQLCFNWVGKETLFTQLLRIYSHCAPLLDNNFQFRVTMSLRDCHFLITCAGPMKITVNFNGRHPIEINCFVSFQGLGCTRWTLF